MVNWSFWNTGIYLDFLWLQQNEPPAVISLRIEELSMMEDVLQRLHLENVRLETGEPQDSVGLQPRFFSHKSNGVSIPKEQLGTENAIMRLEARKRSLSPEFAEQRRARQSLPAWRERQNVVDAVSSHRVVVLTGETGCGKTTQVCTFSKLCTSTAWQYLSWGI